MRGCFISYVIVVTAAVTLFPSQFAAQEVLNDPWAPLTFLIGNWSGVGSGKPGEAVAGSTSFSYDLDRKIIIRKNRAEYAAKPGEKSGLIHEDLMVIYRQPDATTFRAIYFDNEGHVINYSVSFPAKEGQAIFEADSIEKAPRFRLIYELKDGVLNVEFQIAAPGGDFKTYTKGTLKKAT